MDPEKQEGAEEIKAEGAEETVEELKQRLENAKAENARKAQDIQRLREEAETRQKPATPSDPQDLTTWKDAELRIAMKDPQFAAIQERAEEEVARRRYNRLNAEKEESTLRVSSEMERQKLYPETLDPSHPMAVRMSELMQSYRLQNNPAARLLAARLAHSESEQAKAVAAGRKQEQERQADVKANFQGGDRRPAPKVGDKVKLEELKKRAMAGDQEAKAEWFRLRGLI